MEDRHIRKSHNKTCLLYHIVCPVKYRREVLTDGVVKTLTETCLEIQKRYDIHFIEIGTDGDHIHLLVQSVPSASPQAIVQNIKSHTAREIFKQNPEVKRMLWGGHFWTKGYYANTVGQYATADTIRNYVKNQGKSYTKLHQGQSTLFDAQA
ncbi:MAG: transposase [Parcubacteria group bacterium RIFCSPHIGHO2_01_FULL_56_18]|nr:MAG: transposase [Parcubacteria group bacterium RIFCSPHIGHO2_01_FULL_56_18]OHB20121.1 MAG: transposase [Parcubacteria group bacterium RIFCSPHIGHO2_01_FULL_56_18]